MDSFFDSDDFIKPELLAHWYQLAVTQHVDVLIGNDERFNPSDLNKHQKPSINDSLIKKS